MAQSKQKTKKIGKVRVDKSFDELVEEVYTLERKKTKEYIPQLCDAVKLENPELSNPEIQRKVYDAVKKVWSFGAVRQCWPDWIKNPRKMAAGKKGGRGKKKEQEQEQSTETTTETSTAADAIANEFDTVLESNKARFDALDSLIENLCGLPFSEQQGSKHDLVTNTKDHRLKIVKQLDDYNLKQTYGKSQKLYLLLEDLIKQFDSELESRRENKELTSE